MPMLSSSTTAEDSEDIDLLDILTVIVEHLKLLVIGPLLIGLTALLLSLSLPKSYESISLLDAEKPGLSISPSTIVSLSNSADFLDRIALDLGIAKDQSKAARFKTISRLVSASVGRQDKLVTLRTFGSTPEQAQKLNTAVWQHLLPLTLPRGGEMRRLQTLLKTEQARLDDGNRLEQSITQQLQKGNITDQQARLYGELLDSNGSRMRAISALQAQMEGLTVADLVQTPTLPEEAIKPKPALIAAVATLASGMLLLLFVFARHALRSSCQRPEQAAKIAHLRAAFGRSDRKSCA
ncbi:MAG: lipopolysaccharide biosynthesis protein [Acidovorax sp.]|nr:lipopolysaccharide biosynthesis protein [Acidovorax sp.]